jgi:putative CocE/NonD family hydrolase
MYEDVCGIPWGAVDQRPVEARADVLVYTSAPLEEDLELAGPVRVVLHVSSSAPDTDCVAKLVDAAPDGTAYNVQEGIARMRWREGFDRPRLLEPGTTYEVVVDLHHASNVFRRGHRIRVDVTSSNFPWYERNLNVAEDPSTAVRWNVARNVVHHGPEHLSRLELTVIEP